MTDGLSVADAMALQRNNDDGYGFNAMWSNPFVYLIWIYAFRMFGNGWGGDNAAVQGALTRADLFEGFNNQTVVNKLDCISGQLCDGFRGQEVSMLQGFNSIGSQIADNRYAQQNCCCEIKGAIKDISAENYRNTCEITTAIHAEGEATRAMINANTLQNLRDKLADRDREVMTMNLFAAQQTQTQNLINQLKPTPIPAYITCSPYATTATCGCSAY